jgi:hypothetical protein
MAASVRADNAHVDIQLEKLIFAERHDLSVFTDQSMDTNYLYAAHFENSKGKHLGFSMAVHRGPKPEVTGAPVVVASAATQNPEPTAMVLLGTGLAAVAGFARRINRRRRA